MNKKERGITLVALIITVIAMLILAGVAIHLTIGENGIFGKSKDSVQVYNKEEAKQTMNMKITSLQMQNYTKKQRLPTLQELADGLCEDEEMEYVQLASKAVASLDKITVGENKSIYTKIKKYPYEFEIDSNLKLASIDGVKLAQGENSNEELKLAVEELKNSVKQLQEENNLLKESNESLNNKMTVLENEAIYNKRVKLTNATKEIPLKVTNWEVKDCGTIELTDSIENYKYLEIQTELKYQNSYTCKKSILINTEDLKYYDNATSDYTSGAEIFIEAISRSVQAGFGAWFRNSRVFQIGTIWNNESSYQAIRIKAIYGIK